MSFMPIYTKQERRITMQIRDAWWVCPPCELKEEQYCHTECPYFQVCDTKDVDWVNDNEIDE